MSVGIAKLTIEIWKEDYKGINKLIDHTTVGLC